jgi:hypothetical protein
MMDAIKEEDLDLLENQIFKDSTEAESSSRPATAKSTTSSGSRGSTLSGYDKYLL